jgi:hypothetical protein
MPIITQTLCDGCRAVKKETNHWYTVQFEENAHQATLRPMAHTAAPLMQAGRADLLYFCGGLCATEAISQWMDAQGRHEEALLCAPALCGVSTTAGLNN